MQALPLKFLLCDVEVCGWEGIGGRDREESLWVDGESEKVRERIDREYE